MSYLALKTNISVLIYLIKRQEYYTQIIIAANNNAGSYMKNNKLYFFEFLNLEDQKKYQLTAYEILYSINAMYNYDIRQYNESSLVCQNYQVFGGKFFEFKSKKNIYEAFYRAYLEASFYGDVYTRIQNSIYYKNAGLDGCFIFTVPKSLFPNVSGDQIKKAYSNQQIYTIYKSLSPYYP